MATLSDLQGTYTIDASHSRLGFTVRHAMVSKVRGQFTGFSGTAVLDGANPQKSSVTVSIETDTFSSGDDNRDGHVKSADFLDVATYPTMTFASTKVEVTGDDTFTLTGDLTIKDVTSTVTIPFTFAGEATDPFGNQRIGFEGTVSISRKDFGIVWNAALETGGVLVSDKIDIDIDISAIKDK